MEFLAAQNKRVVGQLKLSLLPSTMSSCRLRDKGLGQLNGEVVCLQAARQLCNIRYGIAGDYHISSYNTDIVSRGRLSYCRQRPLTSVSTHPDIGPYR